MNSQKVISITSIINLSDGSSFNLTSTKDDVNMKVLNAYNNQIQHESVKELIEKLNIIIKEEDQDLNSKKELCNMDNCSITLSIILSKGDTCSKCGLKVCESCAFNTGKHDFDKDAWFCDKCK